ncbi:DUF72 domain-containing protein [Glaciihabitans sp. dw_435]|uniref:DUF72 domain-containing protein n=1 Tax=Glaciihabitans sp. dw_435 TaxID=2720081 RepID=UPI001BD65561|nr:DUF72 domain-containing protein [Glaciihabitans sp. dw_435]
MATARVGISGWRYPPWRGDFYPKGLPQRSELAYASEHLSSIEINGSFYSLQLPSSFLRWYDETPETFMFSVKGPRYITHMLHLRNAATPLANFYASGVLALREKLGPTLWQLPPRHPFDAEQLETFFAQLPRSTGEALALARRHDERLDDRAWLHATEDRPLRHALEVRHASFESPEVPELLRAHDVAPVVADTAGKWPLLRHVTSDFVYLRLHGADELYTSGYTAEALDRWAADIRGWMTNGGRADAPGRDAFVYFDNDVKVRAPYDAMSLMTRLAG